ncbi:MAG: DUF2905 domain-containing protein [Actinomycetia bacterium]|nr:DUF2905 domain-containing protein [Actinomycetes bacterium]
MNWSALGKILIMVGIGIAILGALMLLLPRMPFLGNMPGDIHIKREGFNLHIPITTSIILSIVLTIILNIIIWLLIKK